MQSAILTKDDYRTFTEKVLIAKSKGVEIPHMVETLDNNEFKITLVENNYTMEELDNLTEDA